MGLCKRVWDIAECVSHPCKGVQKCIPCEVRQPFIQDWSSLEEVGVRKFLFQFIGADRPSDEPQDHCRSFSNVNMDKENRRGHLMLFPVVIGA